jgi:hypothetical protein
MMYYPDSEEEPQMFWAYRHINGGVHLKNYWGNHDAIDDAYDSDFVDDVLEPFTAPNRAEAEIIAKDRLLSRVDKV